MAEINFLFNYQSFDSIKELVDSDATLVEAARKITANAYAPYSHFHVGAVANLENGEQLVGTNQENASYPAGICAERVLLSAISAIFPNAPINTIAISYDNKNGKSNHPISPCGICRQSLVEYEERVKHPIRLILSGLEGKIIIIERAAQLLPLAFGSKDLS